MASRPQNLIGFIEKSMKGRAQADARWLAKEIIKGFNRNVLGVLYYGSCLRTGKLDSLILDFYVIVEDYKKAYGKALPAFMNRIVPPNVYYKELKKGKKRLRAKVAVLSLEDFLCRTGPERTNVSVWARFSQPSRLVYCRNAHAGKMIAAGIASAHQTMLAASMPLLVKKRTAENIWVNALALTYSAELRSESRGKAQELFNLNRAYFERVTPFVLREIYAEPLMSDRKARSKWLWRRVNGKVVSVLRLLKAAFTFRHGIDYLAWKIERSSGVKVTLKPWQRRFPLLAAPYLFLSLRRKGAFR